MCLREYSFFRVWVVEFRFGFENCNSRYLPSFAFFICKNKNQELDKVKGSGEVIFCVLERRLFFEFGLSSFVSVWREIF